MLEENSEDVSLCFSLIPVSVSTITVVNSEQFENISWVSHVIVSFRVERSIVFIFEQLTNIDFIDVVGVVPNPERSIVSRASQPEKMPSSVVTFSILKLLKSRLFIFLQ